MHTFILGKVFKYVDPAYMPFKNDKAYLLEKHFNKEKDVEDFINQINDISKIETFDTSILTGKYKVIDCDYNVDGNFIICNKQFPPYIELRFCISNSHYKNYGYKYVSILPRITSGVSTGKLKVPK